MLANIFEPVQKCWPTFFDAQHVGATCCVSANRTNMLANNVGTVCGQQLGANVGQHHQHLLANMLVWFAADVGDADNMLGVEKCWPAFFNMFKNVGQHFCWQLARFPCWPGLRRPPTCLPNIRMQSTAFEYDSNAIDRIRM